MQLVNRPQEAVAALQQLNRTYGLYFAAINSYNRAQFQLYRALGYPARILVCDTPVGRRRQVDTSRPPGMAPVCRAHALLPLPVVYPHTPCAARRPSRLSSVFFAGCPAALCMGRKSGDCPNFRGHHAKRGRENGTSL